MVTVLGDGDIIIDRNRQVNPFIVEIQKMGSLFTNSSPQKVMLGTPSMKWRRAFQENCTNSTALTDPTTSSDKPVSSASQALIEHGPINWLWLNFFGTDAANETFQAKLWSLREIMALDGKTNLVLPRLELDMTVTLGALTGVSGAAVSDTEYFADGIAFTTDNSVSLRRSDSPADDTFGLVGVQSFGWAACLLQITTNGHTAASGNATWSGI